VSPLICGLALARESLARRLSGQEVSARSMAAARSISTGNLPPTCACALKRSMALPAALRQTVGRRRPERDPPRPRCRSLTASKSPRACLKVLAQRGRVARMRDVVAADGIAVFRSAVADLIIHERSGAI